MLAASFHGKQEMGLSSIEYMTLPEERGHDEGAFLTRKPTPGSDA